MLKNCSPQLIDSCFDHNDLPQISSQKAVSKSTLLPLHSNGNIKGLSSISAPRPRKKMHFSPTPYARIARMNEGQSNRHQAGTAEAGKNFWLSPNLKAFQNLPQAWLQGARGKKSKVTRNRAALPRSSSSTPAPPAPRDLPPTASRR